MAPQDSPGYLVGVVVGSDERRANAGSTYRTSRQYPVKSFPMMVALQTFGSKLVINLIGKNFKSSDRS